MMPYTSNPNEYNYNYDPNGQQIYANPSMQDMYQIAQMQPILSNNPPVTSLTLFKELTGFPNYGNPSGNADILYTGSQGTWTFEVPPFFFIPGLLVAQLNIRAVLDDHNTPVSRYSATISVNGFIVHRGQLPLEHGRPVGQMFVNWRTLTFNVPNIRRNNVIVITNTSNAAPGDWIGLDWMEMRFASRR
jgi:hypothetical protein